MTLGQRRSQLIPNLAILGLLDLVSIFLSRTPLVFTISLYLILPYVAFVLLKVRDLTHHPDRLSSIDRKLFHGSGPLAVALAIFLLFVALITFTVTPEVEDSWLSSKLGLFFIKYVMELGLVLAIACWCADADHHVRPLFFWRFLTAPLLIIFGLYVVLIPVSQLAGDCDHDRPRVILSEAKNLVDT